MPQCEMCGKETKLVRAIVEGAEIDVCGTCSRFGKVLLRPDFKAIAAKKHFRVEEIVVETIVPNYPRLIKEKRESAGLDQEQLAKKMMEKESLIQKVESGHIMPTIALARKFERALKVNLIETRKEIMEDMEKGSKTDGMTLGDFIKKKIK